MSILDQISSGTRSVLNMMFDSEPINYLEAAGLYGIVAQGQLNRTILEVAYNHAQDSDLKSLIREVLERHNQDIIEQAKDFLKNSDADLPALQLPRRSLHNTPVEIPADARLTDREIAMAIGTMAKAAQATILGALHHSYQLEVALMYRKMLEFGLDWDYRLLQLMLNRGWLPHLAKITH